MNKKKILIILAVLIIGIIIVFLVKNNYKNLKFGNNITSKSIEEIEYAFLEHNGDLSIFKYGLGNLTSIALTSLLLSFVLRFI